MIIIKNFFRIILTLILLTIIAQSEESDKINKNEWVISLEQYFLSLGNIEGSFTQIDQIGNITKGIFAIKEKRNSKINYYSLEDSPLSKLLSKDLSLESCHVNGLEIQGRIATLELRTKKNSERNSIFISADYPQPILRQWKIIDAQKKETTIFFSKIRTINPLLDNFFEIK